MTVQPIKLSTCHEVGEATNKQANYVEVIGEFLFHDGQVIMLKLAGCGAGDLHSFAHAHNVPDYMNRAYNGKLVRLKGELSWNSRVLQWQYNWTVYSVNFWEEGAMASSPEMQKKFGLNC